MKIVICDDELAVREQVRNYIRQYDDDLFNAQIFEYESGEELVRKTDDGSNANIVFLDIEMNKIDGIDTAKLIRIQDKDCIIIFISSHTERVFDTFDCETFNFITKPFTQERFNDVLEKALEKHRLNKGYFIISWKNENIKMPVNKIKFFESYKKHIIFHTYDGEFEMVATLGETLKQLSVYGFFQTHQGYVVNMNLIKRFDGLDIILVDGTKVPMSLRKKTGVLKSYAKHVARYKG